MTAQELAGCKNGLQFQIWRTLLHSCCFHRRGHASDPLQAACAQNCSERTCLDSSKAVPQSEAGILVLRKNVRMLTADACCLLFSSVASSCNVKQDPLRAWPSLGLSFRCAREVPDKTGSRSPLCAPEGSPAVLTRSACLTHRLEWSGL